MNYYAILPGEVRYNPKLSNTLKLFYAELTVFADHNTEVHLDIPHLTTLFKVDKVTIKRWIEVLRKFGLVFVENKKLYLNNRITYTPQVYTPDPPNTLVEERIIKFWKDLWGNLVVVQDNRVIPYLSRVLEDYTEAQIKQAMTARKMIVESDKWYSSTPSLAAQQKDIFQVLKNITNLLNVEIPQEKNELKPLRYD